MYRHSWLGCTWRRHFAFLRGDRDYIPQERTGDRARNRNEHHVWNAAPDAEYKSDKAQGTRLAQAMALHLGYVTLWSSPQSYGLPKRPTLPIVCDPLWRTRPTYRGSPSAVWPAITASAGTSPLLQNSQANSPWHRICNCRRYIVGIDRRWLRRLRHVYNILLSRPLSLFFGCGRLS